MHTPYDSDSVEARVESLQTRIELFLIEGGYRLGTFASDQQIETNLSSGGVRISVRPEYTPVAGDHAVVVTPTTVQSWTRRGSDAWKAIGRGVPYENPDELLEILPSFIRQQTSNWGGSK